MRFFALGLMSVSFIFAQDNSELKDLNELLYSQMNQILNPGNSHIFTWVKPGFPVSDKIPSSKSENYYQLIELFDSIPEPSWIFNKKMLKTYELYENILMHNDTPDIALSDEIKKKLAGIQEYLRSSSGGPSLKVRRYWLYKNMYDSAEYRARVSTPEERQKNPAFNTAITRALQDWKNYGYKDEVENMWFEFDKIQRLNPNSLFIDALSKFKQATQQNFSTGKPFMRTKITPDYDEWNSSTFWGHKSFSESTLKATQKSEFTKWAAGGSGSVGLWDVAANAEGSKSMNKSNSLTKNYKVEFDFAIVNVERDWWDPNIFLSQAWRWDARYSGYGLISSGFDPASNQQPVGQMPFIISGIALARNIQITGNIDSISISEIKSYLKTGGSVGWGPFSVSYANETSSQSNEVDKYITTNGIVIPGIQIVGYYLTAIPKSPNPSANFPWTPPLTNSPGNTSNLLLITSSNFNKLLNQ